MRLEQHQDKQGKTYWLATGNYPDTPLRGIAVEAHTREGARQAYIETFSRQYAEAESMTGMAYMVQEP